MALSFCICVCVCVCSLPPDAFVNKLCPPIVVQDVWYGRWEKQRDRSGPRRSLGLNHVNAHLRKKRDTHTACKTEREKGGSLEKESEYIHPSIECCAMSRHTDVQDDQGTPPVYQPLARHKRLLMLYLPPPPDTINTNGMETRSNATQASAAGASGVNRDKAAGWFQPNRTSLDRHLIIPQARACVFSPGSQISIFHTKFYERECVSPVLRLFRSQPVWICQHRYLSTLTWILHLHALLLIDIAVNTGRPGLKQPC